ncbi:MAG: ABC transporter substrate-binding protein [Acidobacteriales bacterium]|nr:ABC transporter substrate-binding protein [Terriglobales bacterium]
MKRSLARIFLLLILLDGLCFAAGQELRFVLRSEPKTFNPVLVAEDASDTIRYLTGGVLMRLNRKTQQLEPELAKSWSISKDGRQITFKLREGVKFSDGTNFSADDVAFTVKQLMDPGVHSPTADAFRSSAGEVTAQSAGKYAITVKFPAPVASLAKLFDQVAIMSAASPEKEKAVLGAFMLDEYKPGAFVSLKRNPNYWKKDAKGQRLPYVDSVRLDIQQNRDIELLRFRRGEIHLINDLSPELFDRLASEVPGVTYDAGPSLDAEFMWFNQSPNAQIPPYKLEWFRSVNFRRAISSAINRDDISRLVYGKHAQPAVGPVSPANHFWFNSKLKPHAFDRQAALARLQQDGFRLDGATLRDKQGNEVEFSLITNAGNKPRERMATVIQQDLAEIGIKLNVLTLDFPSLIDRMTQSFNYEAILLGLVNTELDPNSQMTVWLSSGDNHQWNPGQKSPETAWEAEIDKLMRAQASTADVKKRKQAFDRVQEIVWEQAPFIYLVNKNTLCAVSAAVRPAEPVVLRPQTYWNAERMVLASDGNK